MRFMQARWLWALAAVASGSAVCTGALLVWQVVSSAGGTAEVRGLTASGIAFGVLGGLRLIVFAGFPLVVAPFFMGFCAAVAAVVLPPPLGPLHGRMERHPLAGDYVLCILVPAAVGTVTSALLVACCEWVGQEPPSPFAQLFVRGLPLAGPLGGRVALAGLALLPLRSRMIRPRT
ncbi:hypothetical protein BRM1_12320 [Brevibacterium sp. BRM-1]|uniref:hypothetical protein n=1 Tax=Brevibacterium sp. BRM-1 TaxID=2999062 RepID=UPI00227F9686|nr:hypothetical protein [Brevibacterium sp. BRM-1]WAL40006.1 hypothetical protein BRM1_12320 [Brevibacterium sp. BRM-1]